MGSTAESGVQAIEENQGEIAFVGLVVVATAVNPSLGFAVAMSRASNHNETVGPIVGYGVTQGCSPKVSSPGPLKRTNPLANATDDEIDAAVGAQGSSNTMISAPQPTSARFNKDGTMMVNEHSVKSATSVPGAKGNVTTEIRVHTPDPSAPAGSSSATGNTVTITQGKGARRLIPGKGWVQTSKATAEQMNQSHIPIHR